MSKEIDIGKLLDQASKTRGTHAVPTYQGGVTPTVGAGTQGAQFRAMTAPKVDGDWFGGAVSQWGKYEAKLLEENDDAIATDAVDKADRFYDELLRHPETGYLNLKQGNVLAADDGVSPLEQMMKKAEDFTAELYKGKNKNQADKIKQRLAGKLNSLYAQGMQHALGETRAYNVNRHTSRIESVLKKGMFNYNKPDLQAADIDEIKGEWSALSPLQGWSKEQSQRELEKYLGGYYANIGNGYLSNASASPDLYGAGLNFLRKHGKEMEAGDYYRLLDAFNRGYMDNESKKFAETFNFDQKGKYAVGMGNGIASGLDNPMPMGGGDWLFNIGIARDGVVVKDEKSGNMIIPQGNRGSEISFGGLTKSDAEKAVGKSISDADWEAIRKDPQQIAAFSAGTLDYYGKKFGSMRGALAGYLGSEKEVTDAMAKAKESGSGNWHDYLSDETKKKVNDVVAKLNDSTTAQVYDESGNEVSPSDPRYASYCFREQTRAELTAQIRGHRLAGNASWLENTVNRVMARQDRAKSDFVTLHNNAKVAAIEHIHMGKEVPPELWQNLTYAEQKQVAEWEKQYKSGSNSGSPIGIEYAANLLKNPARLRDMSVEQLRIALENIPSRMRTTVRKEFEKQKAIARNQREAQYRWDQGYDVGSGKAISVNAVSGILKDMPEFSGLSKEDRDSSALDIATSLEMQNATAGVDVSNEAKATPVIQSLIKDNFVTDRSYIFFGKKNKSIYAFSYNEFPSDVQSVAKRMAAAYLGKPEDRVTNGDVASMARRIVTRKAIPMDVKPFVDAGMTRIARDAVRNHAMTDKSKAHLRNNRKALEAYVDKMTRDPFNVLQIYTNVKLGRE